MTTDHPIISPKKLIEVALPLDAINAAAAREKSIRHGHPSTLHLWWARRPLAAARAVIFSQLVNDPEDLWRCQNPGVEPNKQVKGHWTKARARLFKIIEELVLWENTTNEEVLEKAREEIRKSWREVCDLNKDHPQAAELFKPEKMPGLHDPFAGGGTIPLEAQRLGLEAYASDLNPVAVLINKAMIEIPPKFAGMPPVNPESRKKYPLGTKQWHGAEGLAEDVRYYGKWMRDEAEKRIGHLYPKVEVTEEMAKDRPDLEPYVGQRLTVIAWLWARTVKSPNPAFADVDVPLVNTFVLSQKQGRETFIHPIVDGNGVRFEIGLGVNNVFCEAKQGTKVGRGTSFRCVMSGTPIEPEYIKQQCNAGRTDVRLLAIVCEGLRSRVYLAPTAEHEAIARNCKPSWTPEGETPRQLTGGGAQAYRYGLKTWASLFSPRQATAMTTFSDLVSEARSVIQRDSIDAGLASDQLRLQDNGIGAIAYSESIGVYLACGVSHCADFWSNLCIWANQPKNELVTHLFGRQAIPMAWDYAEANPFSNSGGNFERNLSYVAMGIDFLAGSAKGFAMQSDAALNQSSSGKIISTDPPYYDNIAYADLSDYFYVWLRRSQRSIFPTVFSTIAVPKAEELVATHYRHGSKEKAEIFFFTGMSKAIKQLARQSHPAFPVTIYYAFKQSESDIKSVTTNTGWDTFLGAVIESGFAINGTWPMRTERQGRLRETASNALASSIILVCRPRDEQVRTVSRRDFIRELNFSLPQALDSMTRESEGLPSPVAPVDLSQAIIGPGMAIFSKYSAVLEADGTPMTVRTALQLINRFLAEDDFDADTQFCLHWFDGHGWHQGVFGEADVLARAKATSVNGLVEAGVLRSGGGKVQLLRPADFSADWNPEKDHRIPIWEVLHQLIRALRKGGETEAGILLSQPSVQSRAEAARQLAYRLYTICERKGWAEDARAYNELVTSWSAVESNASREPAHKQGELF
jgi:putative DNA methylase